MRKIKKILLFCVLTLGPARALAWDVSPVLGLNYPLTSISALGTSGSSSNLTFGGGSLFGYDLIEEFGLEMGVLYLPRTYGGAGAAANQTETRLHLPLLGRYRISKFQLLGGFYYSHGLGVSVNGASVSYASLNQSSSDFGLLIGLGNVFPLSSTLGILLRSQFIFGLVNGSTSPLVSLYYRDLQLWVGVSIRL